MATKKGAKKKAKSNWKGGSFRAAVGGYIRKKVSRAGKKFKKGAKKALWG